MHESISHGTVLSNVYDISARSLSRDLSVRSRTQRPQLAKQYFVDWDKWHGGKASASQRLAPWFEIVSGSPFSSGP